MRAEGRSWEGRLEDIKVKAGDIRAGRGSGRGHAG